MLKMRLQRVGRKHEPSFRLVLTESENSTKSGRFTELLGAYDPRKTTEVLKTDRIKHWLSMGAGVTGTVNNLLIKKGIIRGKKTHVGMDNMVKEKPVEAVVESAPEPEIVPEVVAEASVAETPVVEAPAPEVVAEVAPEPAPVEEAPAPVVEEVVPTPEVVPEEPVV